MPGGAHRLRPDAFERFMEAQLTVSDFMSRPAIFIDREASVAHATLMRRRNIQRCLALEEIPLGSSPPPISGTGSSRPIASQATSVRNRDLAAGHAGADWSPAVFGENEDWAFTTPGRRRPRQHHE
jgi:hypothetical protein